MESVERIVLSGRQGAHTHTHTHTNTQTLARFNTEHHAYTSCALATHVVTWPPTLISGAPPRPPARSSSSTGLSCTPTIINDMAMVARSFARVCATARALKRSTTNQISKLIVEPVEVMFVLVSETQTVGAEVVVVSQRLSFLGSGPNWTT